MMSEQLISCPGSGLPPASVTGDIGICGRCGVRTFITIPAGSIQVHQVSPSDVADFRRRGPRSALGSR